MIYLTAEVRHCTGVLIYPCGQVEALADEDSAADRKSGYRADRWVLVGCEFVQRLHEHAE